MNIEIARGILVPGTGRAMASASRKMKAPMNRLEAGWTAHFQRGLTYFSVFSRNGKIA